MIPVEKKKMGRPTDSPKNYRESFRLSEADMQKIKFCMEKTGKSKTEIIRMGIEEVYLESSVNLNERRMKMEVIKDLTEKEMQTIKMSTLYELRLIFTNGEKKEYTKEEIVELLDKIAMAKEV